MSYNVSNDSVMKFLVNIQTIPQFSWYLKIKIHSLKYYMRPTFEICNPLGSQFILY